MNAMRRVEYSKEERDRITDYVCEQIAEKRTLFDIFEEDSASQGLCNRSCFNRWQLQYPDDVKAKVAHARELAMEAYIEEMIDISDGKLDTKPSDDAQTRKVRIYAREKAAQMIAPRRFGQKLDLTSGGEKLPAPAPLVAVQDNRIQTFIALAAQRKAQGDDDSDLRRALLDD